MIIKRLMCIVGAATLLAAPASATAAKPSSPPGKAKGPRTESPAKAYGKYCQGESKKRVEGEKGTAFSRCVKAMRKADAGTKPKAACKNLSKKHVKGEKGTPFSRCVVAAAQLQKDKEEQETEQEQPQEAATS